MKGKLTLVSGGSGSGKSEYAESLVLASACRLRFYLATMKVWDEESVRRVERHRTLRAEKGFHTVEQSENIHLVNFPHQGVVLLEDLSNLTANECYGGCGFDRAKRHILAGIDHILDSAGEVIVVTNELFSDGITYDPSTTAYLALLAELNCALAARSQRVIEVCAGIPVFWKGEPL